jgi:hypothetical protein
MMFKSLVQSRSRTPDKQLKTKNDTSKQGTWTSLKFNAKDVVVGDSQVIA